MQDPQNLETNQLSESLPIPIKKPSIVAKKIPKTATKIVLSKPTRNALKYECEFVCSIKGK